MIKWGIAGIVTLAMLPILIWLFMVATAEIRGKGDAHIQIQSARNRIAEYDYFFSLCGDVQALEGSIDAQSTLLDGDTGAINTAQIEHSIAAMQAERQRTIARYNERATRDYTSGQFRDSDLPFQLNDGLYAAGGDHTTCASS